MNIVAKFYKSFWSDTPYHQEMIDSEINIQEDIKSFDVATFQSPIIPQMEEYDKIELFEVIDGIDELIFSGYVYDITPIRGRFAINNIICRSQKAIMEDRKCLTGYSANNIQIKAIIQGLLQQYVNLGEQWTVECDIIKQTSLFVKVGEVYSDVFDELAKQFSAFWVIKDGVLYFKQNLGIDRSVEGPFYQELKYDHTNPTDSNIIDVSLKTTATRRNIAIISDYKSNLSVDTSMVAEDGRVYGIVEEQFKNAVTQTQDIADKTQKLLEETNRKQRTYSFTVEPNSLNVYLGDYIKVIVENTNSDFDINEKIMVVKKTISYSNGIKMVTVGVGEMNTAPFDVMDWFGNIEKKIKQLSIKE